VARHGVAAEVAVSAATTANYRSVEKALERDLGAEGASLAAQRLTAGAAGTKLAGFAGLASVWECHSDVLRLDQIAQAVYDGPLGETEDRIRALGATGDAFLRDVDRRLHVAGSRALYGGETWAERRRDVWAALRRARGQSPDNGPAARVSDAGADAAQFRRELDGQLRGARRTTRILTGQVVDVRRRLLRRIVDDARLFLGLRESVKSSVLRLGGEERRVDIELASRLVDVGLLDRPDDVELLSDAELDARAAGGSGPSLRELFERRAAVRAAESAGPLPEAFRGTPDADPLDASGAVENPNDRRVLSGWAASPGRVTGRARVVRRLAEGHDLAPGEILVGHTSDPSWSLLFTTAAAIVMEAGGPLSHAAIIAREFRVPAVLNVRGATRLLPSGTPIAVDGTTGQIEILDDNLTEDQP
jgi:pyruvate,water dikinase